MTPIMVISFYIEKKVMYVPVMIGMVTSHVKKQLSSAN